MKTKLYITSFVVGCVILLLTTFLLKKDGVAPTTRSPKATVDIQSATVTGQGINEVPSNLATTGEISADQITGGIRPDVLQYRTAHLVDDNRITGRGRVRWLSKAETEQLNFQNMRSREDTLKVAGNGRAVTTREEAIDHLNKSLSMARMPTNAFEDAEFYYFSGGTTAYPVDDFTAGLIVSKANGEIQSWKSDR